MKTGMYQKVKLGAGLNQSLREAIRLLQYNTFELKTLVHQSISQNPLLELPDEEGDPQDIFQPASLSAAVSSRLDVHHSSIDAFENMGSPKTLRMHLLEQLYLKLDTSAQMVAEWLIDSIDERGYLSQPLNELMSFCEFNEPVERVSLILQHIQKFDPIGIGAADLRECFLLQLNDIDCNNNDQSESIRLVAIRIVSDHLQAFLNPSSKNRIDLQGVSAHQLKSALELIRSLDPAPGLRFAAEDPRLLEEPELHLIKDEHQKWCVVLKESILTRVHIQGEYERLIRQNAKSKAYQSLKEELLSAKQLINGLKKRNDTLIKVAQYIVDWQTDYLVSGAAAMKTMKLADVADALHLHESTVSRVTTGKYIETPFGIFELKHFFSGGLSQEKGITEGPSAFAVKDMIKQIIIKHEGEGQARINDTDIANILLNQGVKIARRTVAKYRALLGLKNLYKRKASMPESVFKLFSRMPKKKVCETE